MVFYIPLSMAAIHLAVISKRNRIILISLEVVFEQLSMFLKGLPLSFYIKRLYIIYKAANTLIRWQRLSSVIYTTVITDDFACSI
jgi:hypothetical protein